MRKMTRSLRGKEEDKSAATLSVGKTTATTSGGGAHREIGHGGLEHQKRKWGRGGGVFTRRRRKKNRNRRIKEK